MSKLTIDDYKKQITVAEREIRQLYLYAYALESALTLTYQNSDAVWEMIATLRKMIMPNADIPEIPYSPYKEDTYGSIPERLKKLVDS